MIITIQDVKKYNPDLFAEAVNIGVEQERKRFKDETAKKHRVSKHKVVSIFGDTNAQLSPVQKKAVRDSVEKIINIF